MKTFLQISALGLAAAMLVCGCTAVSYDRAFPKLTWYWSKDARIQRAEQAQAAQWEQSQKTNNTVKPSK